MQSDLFCYHETMVVKVERFSYSNIVLVMFTHLNYMFGYVSAHPMT